MKNTIRKKLEMAAGRSYAERRLLGAVFLACTLVGGAGFAAGPQENVEDARDRWFLALGAGLATSDAPAGSFTFDHALFGSEKGEFDAHYAGGEASAYELSLGVRLRNRLGFGLALSRSSLSDSADIAGRLPHPFLFGHSRSVEGTQRGLSRDETAIHLSVRWLLLDSSRVQVALFGGPSQVHLDYDLVTAVRVSQAYPYDTAAYAGVERRRESGSATGYHVGVDVVRYFSPRTGLGGVVRYSSASIDLDAADGGTVPVDGGGLQAVVDLRVRF